MKDQIVQQKTVSQFMAELGTVFESFLSQDSGNKSYSLKTAQGPKWIKILNLESTPIDDVQATVQFYNGLRSKMIPQNWHLVALADGLIVLHDWVPGKVLSSPDEDREADHSTYQRFLRLPVEKRLAVFEQIVQLFVEIEEKGILVEDFYAGCVIYDFDKDVAYICDLDHVHFGDYVLAKGRQFGSRRFMAPEEFIKGSTIDRRTNVFTMGASGFVLLNNNRREIQDWMLPQNLYDVLKKAVSHEKEARYASIADFYDDWQSQCEKVSTL